MNVLRGELSRITATRLLLWAAIVAVAVAASLTGVLAFVGPEHANPPMPGIDTAEGAGMILGLGTVTLFIPALLGTVAVTSEYRHRTIGTTFLVVPRRGRVLGAKLLVFAVVGLVYGVLASLTTGLVLVSAAAIRGVELGVGLDDLAAVFGKLTIASAVYVLLGVAIGALARHQLLAIGVVLGYFYFLEYVIMLIPGVNVVYPYLPGGATASLTRFTFLTQTISEQTPLEAAPLVSPLLGALILVGYTVVGALVALAVPLRRDIA
jgi:hypothetical protein